MSITDTPEQRRVLENNHRTSITLNATKGGLDLLRLVGLANAEGALAIEDDQTRLITTAQVGAITEVAYQLSRIADALENRR